jgi:hypothetical protein
VAALEVLVGGGQFLYVLELACRERVLHVLDDHFMETEYPLGRFEQHFTQFGGDCDGQVFVLGDCLDFTLVKVAIIKQILNGQHGFLLHLGAGGRAIPAARCCRIRLVVVLGGVRTLYL